MQRCHKKQSSSLKPDLTRNGLSSYRMDMKRTNNRHSQLSVLFLVFFIGGYTVISPGGQFYKWKDDEGTVHMTDDLSQIPPQYRNQIEENKTTQPPPSPGKDPALQGNIGGISAGSPASGLKRFEVPYESFEGTARRIIIPVTFNGSVTVPMLLDTGSPGLLISPDLAGRLQLFDEGDTRLLIKASGIGGSVPASLTVIDTVSVGGASSEFLPATIASINTENFEGLVGMDFMANYHINIDSNRSVIAFNELSPDLDRPGGHDEAWWRSNYENFSGLRDDWKSYLNNLKKIDAIVSSETERLINIAQQQYDEADRLYRKLDRYARDNNVSMNWRRSE
jgi:hypothetical protein